MIRADFTTPNRKPKPAGAVLLTGPARRPASVPGPGAANAGPFGRTTLWARLALLSVGPRPTGARGR
jgi:hypothetical protein